MISNRALTALTIATTCVILTPRASGGGASDKGFTNPFVSASALGKVHTRGACITNGFVRSQGAASGAYRQNGGPSHSCHLCEMKFHTGGV